MVWGGDWGPSRDGQRGGFTAQHFVARLCSRTGCFLLRKQSQSSSCCTSILSCLRVPPHPLLAAGSLVRALSKHSPGSCRAKQRHPAEILLSLPQPRVPPCLGLCKVFLRAERSSSQACRVLVPTLHPAVVAPSHPHRSRTRELNPRAQGWAGLQPAQDELHIFQAVSGTFSGSAGPLHHQDPLRPPVS